MARITDINALIFPVELRPVYTDIEVNGNTETIKVPNNRAIVDKQSGRPLGIVSNNYKLITNEEAVTLGKQCCSKLIGAGEAANIEIFQVDAPSTGSYCHIDLIHKSYVMNLWDEEIHYSVRGVATPGSLVRLSCRPLPCCVAWFVSR